MVKKSVMSNRDSEILSIFTASDDALQGMLGLHNYITLTNRIVWGRPLDISKLGGSVVQLKITHEWLRTYSTSDFLSSMQDSFEFRQCIAALMTMFPTLEIALRRFRARLWKLGKVGHNHNPYREPDLKSLMKWSFGVLKDTNAGGDTMRKRLPEVCGDIDNARRLRNLAMHNNSKYNTNYIDDAISDGWVIPQFQKNYSQYVDAREPIFLVNADIERMSASMIEFLHMVHNTIQRKFFKVRSDYNYEEEGKTPELYRMTSGRHDVGI